MIPSIVEFPHPKVVKYPPKIEGAYYRMDALQITQSISYQQTCIHDVGNRNAEIWDKEERTRQDKEYTRTKGADGSSSTGVMARNI